MSSKEPVKNPFFLFGLFLILILSVPWYMPEASCDPIIMGFPAWALMSLFMTAILSGFLTWAIISQWDES